MTNDRKPEQTEEEWKAEQAFAVYCALRQAACIRPDLRDNPYYQAMVSEAHADFSLAFWSEL